MHVHLALYAINLVCLEPSKIVVIFDAGKHICTDGFDHFFVNQPVVGTGVLAHQVHRGKVFQTSF